MPGGEFSIGSETSVRECFINVRAGSHIAQKHNGGCARILDPGVTRRWRLYLAQVSSACTVLVPDPIGVLL